MRVVLSWRGGPGSALALARLRAAGHDVSLLHATDARTRRAPASGVPDFLVEEQAACLGLALDLVACDAADGTRALAEAARARGSSAVAAVDAEDAWTPAAGVPTLWPLRDVPRARVAEEALARGVRAFVAACRPPLDPSFLGRFLDTDLVARIEARGPGARDAWRGFAVDGPGFRRRVDAAAGDAQPWGDGWRVDLGLRGC